MTSSCPGYIPDTDFAGDMTTEELLAAASMTNVPAAYDARTLTPGAIAHNPLQQGNCGSCYAFAASTAFSYRIFLKSNGKHNILMSPASGAECSRGCGGGRFQDVFKAMVSKGGFGPQRCDPYDALSVKQNPVGADSTKCNNGLPDSCHSITQSTAIRTSLKYSATSFDGLNSRGPYTTSPEKYVEF